jgi:hypothetical protein
MPARYDPERAALVDRLILENCSNLTIRKEACVGSSYIYRRRCALGKKLGGNLPRRSDHPWRQYAVPQEPDPDSGTANPYPQGPEPAPEPDDDEDT